MLGKVQSDASNEIRRRKSKEAMSFKEKPVWQFDTNGRIVKRYSSISDAGRDAGISPSNIKYTCEGKFTNAGGFLWSYTDTPPSLDIKPDQLRGKKRVQTPDGIFNTVTEVVTHYGFSSTTQVRRRCLSEKYTEWKYIHNDCIQH